MLMSRKLSPGRVIHPLETDTELVLEQFSQRATPAIAQVTDIVCLEFRWVLAHLQDVADDFDKVFRFEKRIVYAIPLGFGHLAVELQTSYSRAIKLARIEAHSLELPESRLHGRRVPGAHLAVDF